MNNSNEYNLFEESKKLVNQLTENAKILNENRTRYNFMFDYADAVKDSLEQVGFQNEPLSDMTVFMLKNLEIKAEDPALKECLYKEIAQSDFLREVATMHFYFYSQFSKRGYPHKQIMELLNIFQ